MQIENILSESILKALDELYSHKANSNQIQLQPTRKELEGDITLVVFPFLRFSKKSPEQTGEEIGNFLKKNLEYIEKFNVIKGFLNLTVSWSYWVDNMLDAYNDKDYGTQTAGDDSRTVMVEYSSPNTNKPLHLGHIRNNLLGYSVSEILKAAGNTVHKTQIINDRGIHICKSMLAWQKFGNGETPQSSGLKGDKLVGKYYVAFDKAYKDEIQELVASGMLEDEAKTK